MTGVGAILGVPLAIIGIIIMVAGPFARTIEFSGPCPYCEHQLELVVSSRGRPLNTTCPACKKNVIIREQHFIAVD